MLAGMYLMSAMVAPLRTGLIILLGCGFLIAAIANLPFFQIKLFRDKRRPKWIEQLVYGLIGLLLIAVGAGQFWLRS
jgi:hypothetical protein